MTIQITKTDLMPSDEFAKVRSQKRLEIIQIKKNRRLPLGPDAMIHFENKATLLWQIQEMLHIEKGGDEQLNDELMAYNPLIPQGHELVSTIMIEIEDPDERSKRLSSLGNLENHFIMRFGSHTIQGVPTLDDIDRTNDDGKTSAVHFIHWPFTAEMIQDFKAPQCDVIVECTHPSFLYKTLMPENVRENLIQDFS